MEEFSAQHCANVAWSCAHLAVGDTPLLAAIAAKFEKVISEAIPQELFNLAWAYGKVGFVVKPLLETIGRQVKARIQQLEARGLANLA